VDREQVKDALRKLGYQVKDGLDKNISDPDYSGIIGKLDLLNGLKHNKLAKRRIDWIK
jgi:hypothetical protein